MIETKTSAGGIGPPGKRPGAPDGTDRSYEWNRALLSVYYHGRKHDHPLQSRPRPMGVWPLARAVAVLSSMDAPIAAQRLALTDLSRTYMKLSKPPAVMNSMTVLLRAYWDTTQGNAIEVTHADEFRLFHASFMAIFDTAPHPDAAYLQAINRMIAHEAPDGSRNEALLSYAVEPQ